LKAGETGLLRRTIKPWERYWERKREKTTGKLQKKERGRVEKYKVERIGHKSKGIKKEMEPLREEYN